VRRYAVLLVIALFLAGAYVLQPHGASLAAAPAFASPPPNALEILWSDYCARTSDPLCATATSTPTPSPSPTAIPTPSPTPTAAPPSPTPTPTASATAIPTPTPAPTPTPSPATGGFILISRADLMALPTSGAAWGGVLTQAAKTPNVNLADLDADGDVVTLAKALVYARTGNAARRTEVIAALDRARASGVDRALELARGVGAYVLAADLIGYRDPVFVTWAGAQRTRAVGGGPATLTECAQLRPNNWGTWCRSSLLIIDIYVGASTNLDLAYFRGYLGDRSIYAGFKYGDLSWQANAAAPVGINPVGATKSGHSIDGVLPDDQRRAGSFSWPPPCENYVAEALQGTTLEAIVLARAGFPSWTWSGSAIGRAVEFKYTNACSFVGDDSFIPFVTDHVYGTHHAASPPSQPGKGSGYYDWLFQ
jgi:hypothetical protein